MVFLVRGVPVMVLLLVPCLERRAEGDAQQEREGERKDSNADEARHGVQAGSVIEVVGRSAEAEALRLLYSGNLGRSDWDAAGS